MVLIQKKILTQSIKKISLLNYIVVTTLIEEGAKLHWNMDAKHIDTTNYQSPVRSFIYLMYKRSNILYAINYLRWFILAPQHPYFKTKNK